jgi:hypothetical protein
MTNYNLNHDAIIYPSSSGWRMLRVKLLMNYIDDLDFDVNSHLKDRTTDDGGYQDSLWQLFSLFGQSLFNGTSCIDDMNIKLCKSFKTEPDYVNVDSYINLDLIDFAKNYATKLHASVNHTYDDGPYSIHLQMVYEFGAKYAYLLPKHFVNDTLTACWSHDLIEDCRITYNDLKKDLNQYIAEITYNLTNNRGRTRGERADYSYYEGIKACEQSTYVKICDRLANATYSKSKGSGMYEKYKAEQENFKLVLYTEQYHVMWAELDAILKD